MGLGRFIAFEGGEGTGKSTQARLLSDALITLGVRCVLTREPGGTAGAEAIRKLLLHPPGEGWCAEAEALLFAAARSDHVARLIRPALDRGEWVICDRFVDSSRAYQGEAGSLGDQAVRTLHDIGSDGLLPDLTIALIAEEAVTAKRIWQRDGDHADAIGGRNLAYHRKVTEGFRKFAGAEPGRFALIDGSGNAETVHERVMEAIKPLC